MGRRTDGLSNTPVLQFRIGFATGCFPGERRVPPLRDGRSGAIWVAFWATFWAAGRKAVGVVDFGARLLPPLHGIGRSGSVFSTTFLNGF